MTRRNNKRRLVLYCLAASLGVALLIGCGLINKAPVIQSIEAERDWVDVSSSINIECLASDPDGDEISYQWSATGGTISGVGPSITWTAPGSPGIHTVAVVVGDGRGGEIAASIDLEVRINSPPVIERLSADAISVRTGDSITIECFASDPDGDGLSYLWSGDEGSISDEGSVVVWAAPDYPGSTTVMVTVSDGRGGEATAELQVDVRANEPPAIEELIPERTSVKPGESVAIECFASDPESDELSYYWSGSGGVSEIYT